MEGTKPFNFIGFGAMDVTKPYEFIGFEAMDGPKPYEFIGFGGPEWRTSKKPLIEEYTFTYWDGPATCRTT
jgi:hypothetical protein